MLSEQDRAILHTAGIAPFDPGRVFIFTYGGAGLLDIVAVAEQSADHVNCRCVPLRARPGGQPDAGR